MASTYGISTTAVQVLGTEQPARITNAASSGTLYLGPSTTTSSGTNATYSVAAGGNIGPVNGPLWAVGSASVPIMVEEILANPVRLTAPETRFWVGGVPTKAATAQGTNTTVTANTAYLGALYIPNRCVLTGVGYLIGTTGGTNNACAILYDSAGNPLAWHTIAGTTVGTANTYQSLSFTKAYEVLVPGRYFVGVAYNGTTATLQVQDGSAGAQGATSVVGGTAASAVDFSAAPVKVTVPSAVGNVPIAFVF